MLITIELPPELESKLQAQSEVQQTSINKLVEDILVKSLKIELAIEEIEKRYVDEWVVVEITGFDEDEEPIKGIVRAHDVNREALTEVIREIRHKKPDIQVYTFYAGPAIPEGIAVIL